MGSVWLAQRSEPVKRKVAVKLIKAGMDSKSVLARFEAERQALSLGVLLCELLAGNPPFAGREPENRGCLEILRVVREK